MKFTGFDRLTLKELRHLLSLDTAGYALRRDALKQGLITPAHALIGRGDL